MAYLSECCDASQYSEGPEDICPSCKEWSEFYCDHHDTEYQPKEPENNVPESLSCAECGKDLPIPEYC